MSVIEEIRTVTSDGRLVIPWTIQQALGLEDGGPVCFHAEDGVVTLRAASCDSVEQAFVSLISGKPGDLAGLRDELRSVMDAPEGQEGP